MFAFILACFSFTLIIASNTSSNLINYYVDLITRETEWALTTPIVFNAYEYSPTTKEFTDYGIFDHIIIGAGTSGAVIANRLSKDKRKNVLLIEAGEEESNFSNIPGMAPYLLGLKYNWNFYSTSQSTTCLGMVENQCFYPRGKGLGGTTATNSLFYSRGYRRDYDSWFAQGNSGWAYKDLKPYFEKLEHSTKSSNKFNTNHFNLEFHEPINLQTKSFIEAHKELGIDVIHYNSDNQTGVFRPKFATLNGQRVSTGRAFLQPIRDRKNLKISLNSFVIKILVNEQKRAYGVIFSKNGKLYIAKSRKDIILSAGVFGSPQILMLSGIGPRFHLEHLGIPLIQDLPVGDSLLDHVVYPGLQFISNYSEPYRSLKENVRDYLNGIGPLTSAFNTGAVSFLQSKYSQNAAEPDIELLFVQSNNTNELLPEIFHYDFDTLNTFLKDSEPQRSITIYLSLTKPKSKGYLRLNSVNPFDYPKIDPRLLSDPDDADIEIMYEGIQTVLQLANTTAFAKINTTLIDRTLPSCRRYKYLSKMYWRCQLRQIGTSYFHPVGTCKMGPDPSKGAVVDPELRVFGIKNLRVADASVFPSQITTHPMATVIVIGEKLANFLQSPTKFQGY